jgi:hypothetical protein
MQSLKSLQVKLIEDIASKQNTFSDDQLSIFSAVAGLKSHERTMIVGRAVNGWKDPINIKSELAVLELIKATEDSFGTDSLKWVEQQWGHTTKYNTKKSAFWRIARAIAGLAASGATDSLSDHLIWTNLYKISKPKGNPSKKLMTAQFELCTTILDAEIDYFKPNYIVFLTGLGWVAPFLRGAIENTPDPSYKFVEKTGVYRGRKFVVGQHPQGKNEEQHLREITANLNYRDK